MLIQNHGDVFIMGSSWTKTPFRNAQYSIRLMLVLTLLIAVHLGLGKLLDDSSYVRGIFSPHSLLAFIAIWGCMGGSYLPNHTPCNPQPRRRSVAAV